MNKPKFPQSKIKKILREHEVGLSVQDILKKYNISMATFYNWKKKYEGLNLSESCRIIDLEEENDRLKRMFAELSLENMTLRKKLEQSS